MPGRRFAAGVNPIGQIGTLDGDLDPTGDICLGGGSTDAKAGTLNNMFNFNQPELPRRLILDASTGEPVYGDFDDAARLIGF